MSLLASYFADAVTWERVLGTDEWGRDAVAPPETIAARVEPANRLVRDRQGQEVVSRARVLTEAAIAPGDWLTLPDGTRQRAIDVRVQVGIGGAEYREVYL